MAQKKTWPSVIAPAYTNELRRYSQKFTDAPEPPSAMAWARLPSPSTRSNAPQVKSAGRRELGLDGNDRVVENAVLIIHRNGNRVTNRAITMATQAAFGEGQFGYASALSVILFIIVGILATAQLRLLRSGESDLA